MLRGLIPPVAALFLAGCGFTPQGDALRAAVANRAAQAYDEGLENAVWFVCRAASIGSVKRRWSTPDAARTYREFCSESGADAVLVDEPDGESG